MGWPRSLCLAALLLLCACGLPRQSSGPDGSQLLAGCATDQDCALGQSCVEGECLAAVVDAGPAKPPCTRDLDCGPALQCVKSTGECIPEKVEDTGVIDAGPPESCTPGVEVSCGTSKLGECRLGLSVCEADAGAEGFSACAGSIEPAAEVCDGKDNDCDGLIDEGMADSICGAGACQVTQPSCENGAPTLCTPKAPVAETCDGRDNDCNGLVDDGIGDRSCGIGACARTVAACLGGQPRACVAGTPAAETCDGTDEDCNGLIDDGLGATTCGTGICRRTVPNCSGGQPQPCLPAPPGRELCNGLDDDCNGSIDDGLGLTSCGAGLCARSVTACVGGVYQSCIPGLPAVEVCNGADDDCDGTIDNGFGSTTCGMGACARTVQNCAGGQPQTCVPGAAAPETCNGIDDDCDGQVDEGLGHITCGLGLCQRSVPSCFGGAPQACTPGAAQTEVCDGLDNNCDGVVDEGCACVDGQVRSCYGGPGGTSGIGLCHAGSQTCASGGWGACTGQTLPSPETCNGQDDNCDGTADDGLGTTSCGTGACRRTVSTCLNGVVQTCVPGGPQPEQCNGVDDDCNGSVDDGFGSVSCGVGSCLRTTQSCVGGVSQACFPGAASAEICNGVDDDCNGLVDDGFGQLTCGSGACARTVPACAGGVTQTCTPGGAGVETCNGVDDDCDGQTDEGLGTRSCGVGACARTVAACSGGLNQTCVPGASAPESCNGVDDDCDGVVDDGVCAPVVSCPANRTVNANTTVTLTTSASSPVGRPLSCQWNVVSRPATSSGALGSATSCNSSTYFADVVGVHTLRFTTTDSLGLTASCTVTLTVNALGDLWVELTWDRPNDMDLHLRHPAAASTTHKAAGWAAAVSPYDCYWSNKTPSWDNPGSADDASLDRDDITGVGPENTRINVASTAHSYAIGVHMYSYVASPSAVNATVKVYCNNVLMTTRSRSFSTNREMWVVGNVQFGAAGACTFSYDGYVFSLP